MPAIFLSIPWYVETPDCVSGDFVVVEVVVERYQEHPLSRLLVW